MKSFSKPNTQTKRHIETLLRGFVKTMYGTLVTVLFAGVVYVLNIIPSAGGYTAVCAFMAAILMFVMGCRAMYAFGCSKGVFK